MGLGLAALVLAAPSWQEEMALRDSLHRVHPRLRNRWPDKRGITLPGETAPLPAAPDSGPLRLAGKWGRGPAVEVTGRDSWIYLSLGSEVAIINFADPDSPRVVSEVQASGLVAQAAVNDSFLYIGCRLGTVGIEVWNIEDPSAPIFRGRAPTNMSDFCIRDTFAYVTRRYSSSLEDTFKVFNMADPANPRRIGSCVTSGDKIAVSGDKVVIADWGSTHVMDVSDPTHPRLAGSIGIDALGIDVRGNLMCVTKWWNGDADNLWLDLVDISNPASPRVLGEIDSVGGFDIHLDGPFAFVSGFYYGVWQFAIVDIQDSTHPRLVSTCGTPGGNDGVWVRWTSDWAFVADRFLGLTVIDMSNINAPRVDSFYMGAGSSVDVDVRDSLMFVATSSGGLQIVNIADPTKPTQLFHGRGLGDAAVAIGDSFAYADASVVNLRVLDITDPRSPIALGDVQLFNPPEDMVFCDSFVYCTEYARLQVVNVAQPRVPTLVGSCNLPTRSHGVALQDSLACVSNYPLAIISVSDPTQPRILGSIWKGSFGVAVQETLVYVAGGDLFTYGIASPAQPYLVDSLYLGSFVSAVTTVDSLVYVGCDDGIRTVSVADPRNPRVVGFATTPYGAWRFDHASSHVYAACCEAGVCIFETAQVGVAESSVSKQRGPTRLMYPTVARGAVRVEDSGGRVRLYDIAGKSAADLKSGVNDVSRIPAGVYFVRTDSGEVHKLILQR